MKWLTSHWFIGFSLLALILTHYATSEPLIERLRLNTFDLYQRLQPRDPDAHKMMAQPVIIDIDDASLEALGQWPWPRNQVAELVDRLIEYRTAVIGFDVVFAEPDRTSPQRIANIISGLSDEMREDLEKLPSHETIFADALLKGRVVLGQVGVHEATDLSTLESKVNFAVLNKRPLAGVNPETTKGYLRQYRGVVRNLPEHEKAAAGIGLFSTQPDDDGIYRRVALVERVGDVIYPSLSLEMLRVALGGKDDYLIRTFPNGSIKDIVVKTQNKKNNFIIPTDVYGRVWVYYANYAPSDPIYISAKDILLAETPEQKQELTQRLGGRLAIIGTSAVGLKDIRATPINGSLPGVEVHLQLLQTILSNTHLTRPQLANWLEIGMITLGGIMMILLTPHLSAVWVFMFAATQIAIQVAIAWYYYTEKLVLVDVSYPSLSIAAMFLTLGYLNYMREERERRQVKHAFSHYVSPALLENLAADPSSLKLGGETRNISIMFSDIRGFTTISEQFDAEGLTSFINKFLTPMTNVVLEREGTIDKYMGDCIMAFWNAPLNVKDHEIKACHSALEMLEAVKNLNITLEAEAKEAGRKHIPINIGVGVNTGDCCVGNMGSNQRFDYSALGDDVNLASRLEGQSKTYGVNTVIGENTYQKVKDHFAIVQLDLLQVKGKTEPVLTYGLLGDEAMMVDTAFKKAQEQNGQMITHYRNREWDKALKAAKAMAEAMPELAVLRDLYIERIEEYKNAPPPENWDGAYIATSK